MRFYNIYRQQLNALKQMQLAWNHNTDQGLWHIQRIRPINETELYKQL